MDTVSITRLAFFILILGVLLIIERYLPRRAFRYPRQRRWLINGSIIIGNTLMLRFLLPFTALSAALFASEQQIGLFNTIDLPVALVFLFSLLLMDLFIYIQHYLFHQIDFLWRMHRLHHTDGDLDVTTALRFHPFEIAISMLYKASIVIVFGIPVMAVIVFEIILNGMAMFNHSNINLPQGIDNWLRKLLITPDMHRVHHSQIDDEMNSNYGFNLSIWDRIFRTYIAQPTLSHTIMSLGIHSVRFDKQRSLRYLLSLPFLPTKLSGESNE